jgi:hypothetical protein
VLNLDATVVCERPRLAPFLPAMQAALAGTLEVPPSAVSIKAKTNEGLDAVGRGEAIAAQAILLIVAGAPPGMLQGENPGGAPEAQTEERKRAGAPYAADDPR